MPSPEIVDIIETLRENEQYLRTIADSALDAGVSMHKRETITFADEVAETVFRYSVSEVMGKYAGWIQSSQRQFPLNAERQEVTAFG
jgi:PAS domain-containing protein